MRHTRQEVIERTIAEFVTLDSLVSGLSAEAWELPLRRAETKDPWTVKDALAHITYWKADVARVARRQRQPPEERALKTTDHNRLVYLRWRDRTWPEVLAWHREVQADVLTALREAPGAWFSDRERGSSWPAPLDRHSADHRIVDIERALAATRMRD